MKFQNVDGGISEVGSQAWWCRPVIPATQESKGGEANFQFLFCKISETMSLKITE